MNVPVEPTEVYSPHTMIIEEVGKSAEDVHKLLLAIERLTKELHETKLMLDEVEHKLWIMKVSNSAKDEHNY